MSDIMGHGGDRQEHLGEDLWVASSQGDLPEITRDEMVGWLEPPSTPMSDSGRSDGTDTLSNGSNEASSGCAQPGAPMRSEGGDSVGEPPQSDPHLKFRPTNLVRPGWETGQWVAETYRRFKRKSGSCDTCGLPYVFCGGGCPGTYDDDMEGALACFGDPRDWTDDDYCDIGAIQRERDDIRDRRHLDYIKPTIWHAFSRSVPHVETGGDWGWAKGLTVLNVALARDEGVRFYYNNGI